MPLKPEPFQPAIWFKLTIDHKEVAYFTEVSGLAAEIETLTYNEGGRNDHVHKLPTRMKHPNLVLKRGVSKTKDLQEWFQDCYEGPTTKDVSLTMITRRARGSAPGASPGRSRRQVDRAASSTPAATTAVEAIEIVHDGHKVEQV